jgi:hypothetical protein
MVVPETAYSIPNFVNSNVNCPHDSDVITTSTLPGSSSADYTATDGVSVVSVSSSPLDASLVIQMPEIQEVERYFTFRVQASALGGETKPSANIKIRFINCYYTHLSMPAGGLVTL